MPATLHPPSEDLREAFAAMANEYAETGSTRYLRRANDFPRYLARLRDAAEGRDLPPGVVPETHFWLVRDDYILGCSRLRHFLTPALEHQGGHIGYDVRPLERNKGYGTLLLRLTVERAAARGIARVRITCDADNIASIRVIEKNGGALEAEVISPTSGTLIRQYWVTP